jgi:hypothetical protein
MAELVATAAAPTDPLWRSIFEAKRWWTIDECCCCCCLWSNMAEPPICWTFPPLSSLSLDMTMGGGMDETIAVLVTVMKADGFVLGETCGGVSCEERIK